MVQGSQLLDHFSELIELDQESVIAADRAGCHGLIVEHVTDPTGAGAPSFRLLAWRGFGG